ncbi:MULTISPECIES: 50S ribosomal protein L25/general stress protein Ctc [Marinobacter]|jgi:large subunit ribosomal protein L25|uniref:Large ribosomal subunit protein bL25 n=1 Tax=Marinobacter salarius TaxID=1420917 RepID=W5YYT5_9GAMM|nr:MULTISPECIES: 50S ribosomal protein L25/general stress protein Ctc [Marinobacter]AHI31388.1 50S ribosomal protein L25 [Marinobacter salarius]ARM85249.1 50S ribosomal protein L25 [Marinobacter salarius]AZR40137.1 50S ribosomal protein L25 [Marinobacter salarius]KXJ46121.1 MAG: 50S ribosomal protein L25/general stress protein Ctc [Marinobacter sp. Hex_13]MAB50355.1 50S ribosomal protein L25 [Marinobacter sp.]|tara:strand:+ start:1632 stop:2285 length:654 start_codon:yes stop_codon:yes gene_type:complete
MSQEFLIEAFPRGDQGRGASRRLRREERKIPAIIYGGKKEAVSISIWHNELKKALENEAFFSHILTIELEGKKESVILKDLQRHPYKPLLTHADFLRVDKDHEIHVNVPLHFLNEETAPAIKLQGGVANHQINEVEVICLPQNLPEFLEVDMTAVEMDQVVHLSDLKLPKGVRIAALLQGEDHDLPVVAIHKPRAAKTEDTDEGEDGEAGEEGEDKE